MPESERIDYPNGSVYFKHFAGVGWIMAPNPFGGQWTMNFNTNKLFGVGYPEYIKRRGKRWAAHFEHGVGWSWVQI